MPSSPSPAPDLAIQPALATRVVGGFGTSILAGAALGVAAWVADQLGYPLEVLLPANAIGAWLGVAFALGASARTIPTGAVRGLVGLLSAVAAYYVLIGLLGEGFRAIGASHAAAVWGGVAVFAGPSFGLAGSTWRHGQGWPRAIAVALLAAALAGEGLYFGAGRFADLDQAIADPGALVLAAEVALGAALPWLLLPRGERLRGYLAAVALAVVAVITIGPVVTFIRGVADRF